MPRAQVTSSVIAGITYSNDDNTMDVTFRNGRVYRYFRVPLREYEALVHAASVGAYFNRRIRDRYPSRRI